MEIKTESSGHPFTRVVILGMNPGPALYTHSMRKILSMSSGIRFKCQAATTVTTMPKRHHPPSQTVRCILPALEHAIPEAVSFASMDCCGVALLPYHRPVSRVPPETGRSRFPGWHPEAPPPTR